MYIISGELQTQQESKSVCKAFATDLHQIHYETMRLRRVFHCGARLEEGSSIYYGKNIQRLNWIILPLSNKIFKAREGQQVQSLQGHN